VAYRKTLTERMLRSVYSAASRIIYRDALHADWMYEKMQRPATCLASIVNVAFYALRIPRVFRITSAMIEPVFGCNLRCKTCWGVLDLEGRRPPLMSWDLFCKLVDTLPKSVESVTFALLGEPLLHPRVHEMVDYIAGRGLRPIIFTNGTLLKGEVLERLARSRLSVLNVTIESDAENAGEMRGGMDLDTVRENVAAFARIKRQDTEVKLSIVAHAKNRDRLSSLLKEWSEFAEHIKIIAQVGVSESPGESPLCLEPWRGNLNFFTNGEVSPCCFDWYTEMSIGNLNLQTMREIVLGEAYRSLLRGFLAGNAPDKCLICKEYSVDGAPLRLRKYPYLRK
jgi:sulfatase maturation enzyme AslB (radical SAM superfamily)